MLLSRLLSKLPGSVYVNPQGTLSNTLSNIVDAISCKYNSDLLNSELENSECLVEDLCENSEYLSELCKISPFLTISTTKMNLRDVLTFLKANPFKNVKVVYLTRDPRAVADSKLRDLNNCAGECRDINNYCANQRLDFHRLRSKNDGKMDKSVKIIRFEDFCLFPAVTINAIMSFLQIPYVDPLIRVMHNHVNGKRLLNGYNKDLTALTQGWTKTMDIDDVKLVQQKCKHVLDELQYQPVHTSQQLVNHKYAMYDFTE